MKQIENTLVKELSKAKKYNYAIPAFNFDNLIMLKAIIEAAEEEESPVIVMITESSSKYLGNLYAATIGLSAIKQSKVPIVLHWDHGYTDELVKEAAVIGFTSVMLDASLDTIENNIKRTNQISAVAHNNNVAVESEIGHVGGKEDDTDSKSYIYTTLEDAKEFVSKTDVDALAVAVGSSHGIYSSEVNLKIDLIKELADNINIPLVLHGSSGIPDDQVVAAVKAGIRKVNFGTDIKIANRQGIEEWFKNNPHGYDVRKFGNSGKEHMKKIIKNKIRICGSNKKAFIE